MIFIHLKLLLILFLVYLVILMTPSSREEISINWSLCILCQEETNEALQSPENTRRDDIDRGAGYFSLGDNIRSFHDLGCLPMPINISRLDEGEGIGATLAQHKAKWHKSCRNKFSNLKLQRAAKRKRQDDDTGDMRPKKVTRRSLGITSTATSMVDKKCFFCEESSGKLHEASTFNMDAKIRECAVLLQDSKLLAKLSAGDLISQEAVYHSKCLVSLYNKARGSRLCNDDKAGNERVIHGIALSQLVAYIEETRMESDNAPVFRLADLLNLYALRVQQLGGDRSGKIHSTDLKNRILAYIPGMQAHKQGRDVLLVFEDDIGLALKKASECDFDSEAMTLLRASNIVRRDILAKKNTFSGEFQRNCQQDAVPDSLQTLVGMILGSPDIKTQSSKMIDTQATLTISQLILYNSVKRRRKGSTSNYHSINREPPLPVYLGLMLHAETRKRGIIDKLYDLGLSIHYDRVLEVSTEMGNDVCRHFRSEGVVCPLKLRKGIFTTAAVDNIDHNPSSTTAEGAFHGTGISLFQHPENDNCGEERQLIDVEGAHDGNSKRMLQLPEFYRTVQPVILPTSRPVIPPLHYNSINNCLKFKSALKEEFKWLEHVREELNKEISEDIINFSWAAYHASIIDSSVQPTSLDFSSLMPLFEEEAASVTMIRHAIEVVSQAVGFLNPNQIPVIACDQPLFAIEKKIQWHWPDLYGENKVVIMFGGLHTELAALKAIGQWIVGSGWTNALVQAGVTTPGTADYMGFLWKTMS